jgi:serine/threonine protein kinase
MGSSDRATQACLSNEALQRYHARELAEQEAAAVREHLQECPSCAERAAALCADHDTWVERIRAAGAPPEAAEPPVRQDVGVGRDEVAGYEILEEIRRGGQGIVYRALQRSTKRAVALKVLREGPYASEATRRRFEREIELVAGLSHPHIVTVFDSGQTADGRRFLAMDFVRGKPLDQYVAGRAVSLPERLRLFSTVCRAVNYAHQRGVIHRDLKPSNILVDEGGEPHVLDFGLARPVAARGMTTTGQVAGTIPYMSPEQARGLPDATDVRSDVYALGVILYELLTGHYPYPVDGDVIQVLKHIAETPPTRPSRTRRHPEGSASSFKPGLLARVGAELDTIVLKALAKEPDDRYQSAGELARDVDHYLAGEPIEARRDSGWYLLRKTLYRHRLPASLAAAFVVLITVSAVALGVMYATQARLRVEAVQQGELARNAETKAHRRFEQARELARILLFDFNESMLDVPGSAAVRKKLIAKELAHLQRLSSEAAGDMEMRLFLAGAYMNLGDIQGDVNRSSLGDPQAALESYRQAQQILEEIAARVPADVRARRTMINNLLRMGDMHGLLGAREAALQSYQRALDGAVDLLGASPQDDTAQESLGDAHARVAGVLERQGDLAQAMRHYEESWRIAAERAAAHPADPMLLHDAGSRHAKMGELYYTQGKLDEALESYRACLAVMNEVLNARPESATARRSVGITLQWLGIVSADRGERDAAVEYFGKSIAMLGDLLRDDPDDVKACNNQVTNYIKLGEVQVTAGQTADARDSFAQAVALSESLTEHRPGLAAAQRNRGVAYYKMFELHKVPAEDATLPAKERAAHWRTARDWLTKCRGVFVEMRVRGTLAPADERVPEELAAEIAGCDTAIEELTREASPSERGAPAQQPQ